jgi:hypothetical protein
MVPSLPETEIVIFANEILHKSQEGVGKPQSSVVILRHPMSPACH